MPKEIMILLIVAGAGILGSIALLICNGVMGRRSAVQAENGDAQAEDEPGEFEEEMPQKAEEAQAAPPREVKFTPLGEEPVTAYAPRAGQESEEDGETVAVPLHLVQSADDEEKTSARVGQIVLSIGNAQEIGMRSQQQDAFAITPLEEKLVVRSHGVMAVVCDGMGGMENGAEAANMGAIQFMRAYLAGDKVDNDSLVDAVYEANTAVYQAFWGKDGNMAGTTLVAASVLPDGLRFVSVGDSHIYLFRKEKLYQLNRDHNYFSELMQEVEAGKMTLEEAQRHPERAHLTSFVGIEKLELVDYNTEPVALRPGDRVLLCSDGLFKTLSLMEMARIIAESAPHQAQDELMRAVREKGKRKQDNVTLVLLYCDRA